MGETSRFHDDWPEENAANYVNRRFDPKAAAALRARTSAAELLARLSAQARTIAQMHRPKTRASK